MVPRDRTGLVKTFFVVNLTIWYARMSGVCMRSSTSSALLRAVGWITHVIFLGGAWAELRATYLGNACTPWVIPTCPLEKYKASLSDASPRPPYPVVSLARDLPSLFPVAQHQNQPISCFSGTCLRNRSTVLPLLIWLCRLRAP